MVRSVRRRRGGAVRILLWIQLFLPSLTWHRWSVVVAAAGDLGAQPDQRVVLAPDHPFLQGDQRVVGDLDVLRAGLGAALGDVAVSEAEVVLGDLAPVG